jgi:hypothetical protein
MPGRLLTLIMLSLGSAGSAAAQDIWKGRQAAFFGVVYLDTSLEGEIAGPRADETARIAMVQDILVTELEGHGLILLELAPVVQKLERVTNPANCYGCEIRMAAELGADYAVVAEVQKVSTLIQSMNVVVRDAATGSVVRGSAVDLRGNTDEAWARAMRYLLENRIFTE